MKKPLIISSIIALLILPSLVYAIDILDSVLKPFQGVDIGALYLKYVMFIDAVVYLILFMSLAQFVFVKVYGKKEGKLVSVAIGLALMFGMMALEARTGFNLSQLGPFAALILLLVLGFLFYNLVNGMFNDPAASFSLTFLVMYAILMSSFSLLYKWLEKTSPLLAAILHLTMVAAFILLIIRIIGMFGGGKDDKNNNTSTPQTSQTTQQTKSQQQPQQPTPSTINIVSPTNGQTFNPGDSIKIHFSVSGPEFTKNYDYDLMIDGMRYGERITNVGGTQVVPFPIKAGLELKGNRHIIQITALSRNLFGGTNNIIAQSNVVEIIIGGRGGGGGAPQELLDRINNLIACTNQLEMDYVEYVKIFYSIISKHNAGNNTTLKDWSDLLNARNTMIQTIRDCNKLIVAIQTHASYPTLNLDQLNFLTTTIIKNTHIRRLIMQYEIQARDDYNNRRAPRSPPMLPRP
ncbi:MAG: hypothetical protein ACP5NV_06775 [Candidatus Woesearchaeota archaeon]